MQKALAVLLCLSRHEVTQDFNPSSSSLLWITYYCMWKTLGLVVADILTQSPTADAG
jgi:hypothetical protein